MGTRFCADLRAWNDLLDAPCCMARAYPQADCSCSNAFAWPASPDIKAPPPLSNTPHAPHVCVTSEPAATRPVWPTLLPGFAYTTYCMQLGRLAQCFILTMPCHARPIADAVMPACTLGLTVSAARCSQRPTHSAQRPMCAMWHSSTGAMMVSVQSTDCRAFLAQPACLNSVLAAKQSTLSQSAWAPACAQ